MSECYCDYEPYEFCVTTTPTARKAHRCGECRSTIAGGERYERVSAKWDGQVETLRTCGRCLALREYVEAHVPCFCWAHGEMLADAEEVIRDYWHECPGLFMGYGRLRVAIERHRKTQRAAT